MSRCGCTPLLGVDMAFGALVVVGVLVSCYGNVWAETYKWRLGKLCITELSYAV